MQSSFKYNLYNILAAWDMRRFIYLFNRGLCAVSTERIDDERNNNMLLGNSSGAAVYNIIILL
jgi:hypothetical protein